MIAHMVRYIIDHENANRSHLSARGYENLRKMVVELTLAILTALIITGFIAWQIDDGQR